ncbi:MAG: tetratricopeptide repeat protein [Spartobacteria bacterium]|nr:tetratricopeptide repeat protein [Spartobacteria bacterium]
MARGIFLHIRGMQFSAREILNILPPDEWKSGWRLQSSCWGAPSTRSGRPTFETLGAPGDVTAAREDTAWSFHVNPPRNAAVTHGLMMLNGFFIAGDSGSAPFAVACFVPEPGILWGMSSTAMIPQLFSHAAPVRTTDTEHILETPAGRVFCRFDASLYGTAFCLVFTDESEARQTATAEAYMRRNFDEYLTRELGLRSRFLNMEMPQAAQAAGARQSIELLAGELHPPGEVFPYRWSNCGEEALRMFDINTIFPLVETWKHIDASIAAELTQSALSTQTAQGMVPAWVDESGMAATVPCLPLLAQAALSVYEATRDPDFLLYAKPRLIRYLTWAWEHYDPMHDGRIAWQTAEESFIPETFYPHVTSVDLLTFLLCEQESVLRMCRYLGEDIPEAQALQEKRGQLVSSLLQTSWDPGTRQFRARQVNGPFIDRLTLASVTPLLWQELPEAQQAGVGLLMSEKSPLMSNAGLTGWETWESDRYVATVQPLHQFVMLTALRRQNLHAGRGPLAQRLSSSLFAQTERPNSMNHQLINHCLRIQLLLLEHVQQTAEIPQGACIQFLDRHALLITAATAALITISVGLFALATLTRKSMTIPEIESNSGLAELYYKQGQYDKALDCYTRLSEAIGENAHFETRRANAYFKLGRYEEAEAHYRNALDRGDDSPTPLMNLALTLHRQGRSREAILCYVDAARQFKKYPELKHRAIASARLIKAHHIPPSSPDGTAGYANGG